MSSTPLEIIILAAGKGSRMKSALPKILHCIAGKPLLQHVLDASLQLEPSKIHIIVGHGKQQVMDTISHPSINWVEQSEQLGTGHAVQQAMPAVAKKAHVIMLTADVPLITLDTLSRLNTALDSFSLVLLTALMDDATGYGRILHDDNQTPCGIVEQKDASAEQLNINEINSGIIAARAEQLNDWLGQLDNNNQQKEYYLTDIVKIAYDSGNPITSFQASNNNEIIGINSRVQLAQVERIYQLQKAHQLMDAGVTIIDPSRIDIRGDVSIGSDTIIDINAVIEGPCQIGSNVHIGANCVIQQCQIADNVTIHPNTVMEQAQLGEHVNVGPFARLRPGTELQSHVRIGNFVETKNAKLATGSKINHLSYVGDAKVGSNTNIGAGVITCNYDGAYKHQTIIGNDVFVGSDSQLVAPVSIADGATIGAGSTITSDVDKDQLAISRAKQRQIDGWQRPRKKS